MKRCILLFLLLVSAIYAQTQTLTVSAGVPSVVTASASYTGAPGVASIYYYVCARYPSGYVCMSSPAIVGRTAGISSLGGGNSVIVNWAPGASGATGYDVARFGGPGGFSGNCTACIIASNITATSWTDTNPGTPAGNYPPAGINPVSPSTGVISLDNIDWSTPGLLFGLNGASNYGFGLVQYASVTSGHCAEVLSVPPFLADAGFDCGSGGAGITQLHQDVNAGPGVGNQAATVVGLETVPFCSGFAPSAGQFVEYTTGGTPSPCWNAAAGSGGTVTGSGTTNHLPKWTGPTALGNSDATDAGGFVAVNTEPFSFTVNPGMQQYPNDATGGTVVNTVTKIVAVSGTAEAVQATTSDLNNNFGICTIGCGTGGNAQLAFTGQATCLFDGSTTIRDYVQVSSTVAGDCHDAGATEPHNGQQTIGRVITTNSGAGTTAVLDLNSPDTSTHGGGSVNFNPTPTTDAIVTAVNVQTIKTPDPGSTLDTSGNGVFSSSVTSADIASTGPVTAGGDVDSNGVVNAGVGGTNPSAYHYFDTGQAHDTVYQAPSSGYNGTVTAPSVAPVTGQVRTACTGGTSAIECWATPTTTSVTETAGSGGVTANLLASKDASNPTLFVLPGSGGCGTGFALASAASSATFPLASVAGTIQTGVADNAITAGHILVGGTTTPGRVKDSGFTGRGSIDLGTCVVGVALANASTAATVSLLYDGVGSYGTATLHNFMFTVDGGGSTISTGDIKFYPTADAAGTIKRIDISADQSCSVTIDIWKAAGAIPTSGNKISASAPLTLSSAQLAQNGSTSGWTLTVAIGDVWGASVATVTGCTKVTGQVWYGATI